MLRSQDCSSPRLCVTSIEHEKLRNRVATVRVTNRYDIENHKQSRFCKLLSDISPLPCLPSQYLMLLQAELRDLGVSFLRIDGGSSASERQDLVSRFQRRGCDVPVFLLTSQVGGLGLTLTAATRVIIVDPAWNPSTDNQVRQQSQRQHPTTAYHPLR